MSITPTFWMPVVAAANRDDVDAALETTALKAWALNGPAEFYAHHGAAHPMGADFAGMQDHVAFTLDEKTIREKAAQVPLPVVKGMVLNGTVDDVVGASGAVARSRCELHRRRQLRSDAAECPRRTCDHAPVQQGGARPQAAVN